MAFRRWQNLIHKKCPDCDTRLVREAKVYGCPNCDFYITPAKLASFITDENGPTYKNMSQHEKEIVIKAKQELGIVA